MPKVTLPSKKISVVDVPETKNFRVKFRYNFFVNDERINESGLSIDKYRNETNEFDRSIINSFDFNSSIPRYVDLNWISPQVGRRLDLAREISIEKEFDKINFEDSFSYDDYSYFKLQDTGIDNKLSFYIKRAYDNIVSTTNNEEDSDLTLQERAVKLNNSTSEEVKPELLELGLGPTSANSGVNFFGTSVDGDEEQIKNDLLEKLKKIKIEAQVNNLVIGDFIAATSYEDVLSPFVDEVQQQAREIADKQFNMAATRPSTIFDVAQYDLEIKNSVRQYSISDISTFESFFQIVGYIIYRSEVNPDGTLRELDPIFIEDPETTTSVDLKIKYGSSYQYRIHTVAYIEIPAYDLENLNVTAVGFLVGSKAQVNTIECIETAPPPPVADFRINYDYKTKALFLSWAFPFNPQRDIKKFQVFRRTALNEPFQLLKEYDFDDSLVKSETNEFPDEALVEKTVKTIYFDKEFNFSSNFIYAICCMDAHGYSSPYSTQFNVKFDKVRNKIVKTLISVEGAPKAYPNIFLNRDTFVDTIKDEGHGSLQIYFDPEYLKVINNKEENLHLLSTKELDKYVLQLINADLQAEQKIEIRLIDRMQNRLLR